jgi:hypothetical protein
MIFALLLCKSSFILKSIKCIFYQLTCVLNIYIYIYIYIYFYFFLVTDMRRYVSLVEHGYDKWV